MGIFGSSRKIEVDIVANDRVSPGFNSATNSAKNFANNVNNAIIGASSGLNRYNNAMSGLYRTTNIALLGAGALVTKFTKDAINSFADFERQHAQTMGAIANDYKNVTDGQQRFLEQSQKLKQESIRLGTYGPNNNGSLYSPTDVSSVQTTLSKAGIRGDDLITATPQIIKFAGGNNLSTDSATEYAVNIASMYDIPVDQWGDMLDKVTRTADQSTVDVSDIFTSMKYAGEMGSSMGRDLEEALGMIAILGNAGLRGSQAGTGIQSLYTRTLTGVGVANDKQLDSAPTERVKSLAENFPSMAVDENGNMIDMPSLTDKIAEATKDLNDQEQAWFMYRLFGLNQMKAAYKLKGAGGFDLSKMIEDIRNNSGGTNDTKYDIMSESAYGKRQKLLSTWEGTKMDFGERISPFTNKIFEELNQKLIDGSNYDVDFSGLHEALQEGADKISEKYGEQIGDIVESLGNIMLDGSRIGSAVLPTLGGGIEGLFKLLSGDIPGALEAFKDGITNTNDNIMDLPPELQNMAKEVKNAVTALMALAGVNWATKIAENLATVYKYTLGKMVTNTMSVTATTVILKDTGVVDANGKPIYSQEKVDTKDTKGNTGGTAVPNSTVAVDANGKKTTPQPGSVIIDSNGKQIGTASNSGGSTTIVGADGRPINSGTSGTPAPTTNSTMSKIGGVASKASWIYFISEMFGLTDKALDGVGAKEGTTTRKVADDTRTVINYTLMASLLDKMLLNGKGFSMVSSGASKLWGGAELANGALATASPFAMLTGPILASLYAIGTEYQKNKQGDKNRSDIIEAYNTGKPVYWDNDGNPIFGKSEKEQAEWEKNREYTFRGNDGETIAQQAPNRLLHPIKYREWEKQQQKIAEDEERQKSAFEYAQGMTQKYSNKKLKWTEYEENKDNWENLYKQDGKSWDSVVSTMMMAFGKSAKQYNSEYELAKTTSKQFDGKSLSANDYLSNKGEWSSLFKSQSDALSQIANSIKTDKDNGTLTDDKMGAYATEYANMISQMYTGKEVDGSSIDVSQWISLLEAQIKALETTNTTIDGMQLDKTNSNTALQQAVNNLSKKLEEDGKVSDEDKDAEVYQWAKQVSQDNGRDLSMDEFNVQKDQWTQVFIQQCDQLASSLSGLSEKINNLELTKPEAQTMYDGAIGPTQDGMLPGKLLGGDGGGGDTTELYNAIIGVKDGQDPMVTSLSSIDSSGAKNSDVISGLSEVNSTIASKNFSPIINISPPSVDVKVNVDQSGNVSTSQSTSYVPNTAQAQAYNNLLGREKSRYSE